MEWDPEPQDEAPFWPGAAERRQPRWVPIVIAVVAAVVVVGGIIWWFGRGGDDGDADAAADNTAQVDDTAQDETPAADPPTTDSSDAAIDSSDTIDGAAASTSSTTTSATTTTVAATTTTLTTVPPENVDQFGPATLSANSTVSTVGLDTVHFGMTVAQAQQAAGTVLVSAGPTGACYHAVPHDAPEGVVFLIHHGTVERVDINSGPITTRSGVGVGSPESLVTDLFGDSIERQVRVDGTVDLVFVPSDPGDRNYRVVFNIADGAVRAYKSGRLPQIMLDTGCETP